MRWVLERSDGQRKRIVLQFLQESQLIRRGGPVVNLTGANLSEANLRNASLIEADLSGATFLIDADLSYAFLLDADLSKADLNRADLYRATVTNEQLDAARTLEGATMPDGSTYD